ncbi:class II aldolase/adducin family protein [Saccharospirillum sp.]|uniref:class II aldolase/adducin family protein n=1 Tax=Saccharospirillum sp. TaxID=2033801 RepID=UPI00349FF59C
MATQNDLITDLSIANRILFNEGVVDAFGHVSVRNPENPEHFFLSRNMAPNTVSPSDILEHELDGTVVGDDRKPYLERYIHGEIYRKRPDVMAVVHSHSPSIVPFSVVKSVPLRPVCHMSCFIHDYAPIYEIRDHSDTPTDLLISNQDLGQSLAKTLGDRNTVLMRGHGSTVVADSLMRVVYRAVYLEVNAKLQAQAMSLGEVTYLSKEEAEQAMVNVEGQMVRAWDHWKSSVSL